MVMVSWMAIRDWSLYRIFSSSTIREDPEMSDIMIDQSPKSHTAVQRHPAYLAKLRRDIAKAYGNARFCPYDPITENFPALIAENINEARRDRAEYEAKGYITLKKRDDPYGVSVDNVHDYGILLGMALHKMLDQYPNKNHESDDELEEWIDEGRAYDAWHESQHYYQFLAQPNVKAAYLGVSYIKDQDGNVWSIPYTEAEGTIGYLEYVIVVAAVDEPSGGDNVILDVLLKGHSDERKIRSILKKLRK